MATQTKWLVDREKTLDDFANKVSHGEFDKMPYQHWRKMYKEYPYSMLTIKKTYNSKGEHIGYEASISHAGDSCFSSTYGKMDGAFGSYIQKYIDKDEKENMTYDKAIKTTIDNCYINDLFTNYSASTANSIATGDTYSNATIWSSPNVGTVSLNDDYIRKMIDEVLNENKNKDKIEENKMNTSNLFNFEFGPVLNGSVYRMSPFGLAVRTDRNGWVAYNTKTGELVDVDVLNFDISKLIYKMPVALTAVKPGDVLIHGGKPVFVRAVGAGANTVSVIDYATASVMDILPVKSPFGFNFFTKVTPLFDMNGVTADADNPFGNMLPFLMLSGDNNDFDPTLLFLAGGMGNMDFTKNPMMLYFLANRKDKSDILPFLLMMNGGNMFGANGTPAPVTTLK